MNIAAIDIGGTNIRISIFDNKNNQINYIRFKTNPTDFKESFNKIGDFINENNVCVIGIGIPGPANYTDCILIDPPTLPNWKNINYGEILRKLTGVKHIYSENDANLMTLAHHKYFKQKEKNITVFFTISTGLGSGVVVNNKLYQGANGTGFEIAVMPASSNISEKNKLGPGAAEYFISGSGISARGAKYLKTSTTQEVFDLYHEDLKAKLIIDEAIAALSNVIAIFAAMINPDLIVFDGSVAMNNKWFVKKAIKIAKGKTLKEQFDIIKYKFSELNDDSTLLGAYHLVKMKTRGNNG